MKLVSSAFKIALGIVIAQSIIALSVPLLTRIYDAKDFALYGYLFSASSLLGPLVFFRLESFAAKEKTDVIKRRFIPCLVYMLPYTIPFVVLTVLLGFYIFPHNEIGTLPEYLMALLLVVLSCYVWVFFNVLSLLNVRKHKFKSLGIARVSKSFATVITQLLLSFKALKFSLFYGELLGRCVAVTYLLVNLKYKIKSSRYSFNYFYNKNRREINFNFSASLLNSLSLNLFPLFVVSRYSPELAGSFFLLFKMIGAPLNILTQSLATSYLGNISEYIIKKQFKEITSAVKKTTCLMVGVCLLSLGSLFLIFNYFQSELFGEGWGNLTSMLLMISPMIFGQVVFSPFSKLLVILGCAKLQLKWDAARFILLLVLILSTYIEVGLEESYIFNLNLVFFSFIMLMMYVIHYFISLQIIARKCDE